MNKKLTHMIVVIFTIMFFFVSPLVHQKWTLRASTLTPVSDSLPPLTQDAEMYVDHLRLTNSSKGEYELAGWGFCGSVSCSDLSVSSRKILLVSDKGMFSIDAIPADRPDVEEVFKDLNLNLKDVGFSVKILKDALPKGSYRVYLQFFGTDGTKWAFESNWSVIRSSNDIKLARNDDGN